MRPPVSERSSTLPSSRAPLSSRSPPSQHSQRLDSSPRVSHKQPVMGNQFEDDPVFQRVLFCMRCFHSNFNLFLTSDFVVYLPDVLSKSRLFRRDLHRLARYATSKRVENWIRDAEKNPPYFELDGSSKQKIISGWGRKKSRGSGKDNHSLPLGDGWQKLGEWGAREGFVNTNLFKVFLVVLRPFIHQGYSNWI